MAKLIDLNGLAHVYSIIKGMLADKLGKNDTAVNASKVNNLTVETAVPKNAQFTDTVYTHPSTHPASMITGLASVATSGSYNDLTDKPTIPAASTVDSELSSTSTNPVQNKVIKVALDGKLGKNETAARATQDGAGNIIVDTYAKKTDITNITVDSSLSSTSTNPIQNKAVKTAIDTVTASIPTKVSALENDAGYLTQHQSLDGYAKTSVANTWTAEQNFHDLILKRERYTTYGVNGTYNTPTTSTIFCTATGAFTLNLATLAGALSAGQSSVFTAYFAANADYSLTITNAGTIKYIGNASDVAITSAGLLLNILMLKDDNGNLTSIVQASKLS